MSAWEEGCSRYILVSGHTEHWKVRTVENGVAKNIKPPLYTEFRSKEEATQAGEILLPGALVLDGIMRCVHCGEMNFEDYAVTKELWRSTLHPIGGRLHLRCLEKRIGRPLVVGDFPSDINANNTILFGYRLGLLEINHGQ